MYLIQPQWVWIFWFITIFFLLMHSNKWIKSRGKTIINWIIIKISKLDQIKQFFCGLTHYYAVQCTRYLKFICLHFAVGYPTSNAIFSSIQKWNGLVLVFKWKLRTWGIQKCPYISLYQLLNLSYKPLNIIGPFYLIAAVDAKMQLNKS